MMMGDRHLTARLAGDLDRIRVRLAYPVTIDGEVVDSLILRRARPEDAAAIVPHVDAIEALHSGKVTPASVGAVVALVALLSDTDAATVEALDWGDVMTAANSMLAHSFRSDA